MICPCCKETVLDGAVKCRFCGSTLNPVPAYGMNTDSITADEIRAFVGDNAHYYIQKFSKYTLMGREKFCVTWNWSCFGFTFLWMLYRKMYVLALITFVIFFVPGFNIILHIIAGIAGNYLYYRHVKKNIFEIRAAHTPQNSVQIFQEVGGVHKWVVWIGAIFGIILAVLFALFFSTMIAFMGQQITRITI
jgi:hypothetical protein